MQRISKNSKSKHQKNNGDHTKRAQKGLADLRNYHRHTRVLYPREPRGNVGLLPEVKTPGKRNRAHAQRVCALNGKATPLMVERWARS